MVYITYPLISSFKTGVSDSVARVPHIATCGQASLAQVALDIIAITVSCPLASPKDSGLFMSIISSTLLAFTYYSLLLLSILLIIGVLLL